MKNLHWRTMGAQGRLVIEEDGAVLADQVYDLMSPEMTMVRFNRNNQGKRLKEPGTFWLQPIQLAVEHGFDVDALVPCEAVEEEE